MFYSCVIDFRLSYFRSNNGFVDISAKVPDTITTWEANAYALNAKTGLGVAPVTSNVSTLSGIRFVQEIKIFKYRDCLKVLRIVFCKY